MLINLKKYEGHTFFWNEPIDIFRNSLKQLFPNEIQQINILAMIYDSGILEEVSKKQRISQKQFDEYVNKLESEYGIQKVLINENLLNCINSYQIKIEDLAPDSTVQNNRNGQVISGSQDDFEIKINDNDEIELVKFLGFENKEMIVPNQIDGKPVVSINYECFQNCKEIQSLIIPEGIRNIESRAFYGCKNLENVKLPSTLTKFGGDNLKRTKYGFISMGVFGSTKVKNLTIPDGVIELGEGCCGGCSSLEVLKLPNSIKVIPERAFAECENLRCLNIPNNICRINDEAFCSSGLTEVELPNKIDVIGRRVFIYCRCLKTVVLSNNLRSLPDETFFNCGNLKNVVIPQNVATFGKDVFKISKYVYPKDGRYNPWKSEYVNNEVTIFCESGSPALKYARQNDFKVKHIT